MELWVVSKHAVKILDDLNKNGQSYKIMKSIFLGGGGGLYINF